MSVPQGTGGTTGGGTVGVGERGGVSTLKAALSVYVCTGTLGMERDVSVSHTTYSSARFCHSWISICL